MILDIYFHICLYADGEIFLRLTSRNGLYSPSRAMLFFGHYSHPKKNVIY